MSAPSKVDGPRCLELAGSLSRCGARVRPHRQFGQEVLEALSGRAWEPVYRRGMLDGLVPECTPLGAVGDFERPLPEGVEDDLGRVVGLLAEFLPWTRTILEQGDSGEWTATVRSMEPGPPVFTLRSASPSRALLWAALLHAAALRG